MVHGSRAMNESARDARAADLQEEMVTRSPWVGGPSAYRAFLTSPTKTAATYEHRSERSEQLNTARERERRLIQPRRERRSFQRACASDASFKLRRERRSARRRVQE